MATVSKGIDLDFVGPTTGHYQESLPASQKKSTSNKSAMFLAAPLGKTLVPSRNIRISSSANSKREDKYSARTDTLAGTPS